MTPCIVATGSRNKGGYIRRKVRGKRIYAHRLAWIERHGPIPDGLIVRHRCDNPPCVNVDHLQLGTHSDNVQDMLSRNRGNFARGEASGTAKLTDAEVEQIRDLWPDRGLTQQQVADMFGVTRSNVSVICNRKSRLAPTPTREAA